MAKLQQMNEMTKQNSQILLIDGYVTMNGKRYDECVPFEKEAFNDALGQELHPDTARVRDEIFNNIIEKLQSDPDGNEEQWGLYYKDNYYDFILYADARGTYSESSRRVNGEWLPIAFTDEQWAEIEDLLDIEGQVQEMLAERRYREEIAEEERMPEFADYSGYGFLTV